MRLRCRPPPPPFMWAVCLISFIIFPCKILKKGILAKKVKQIFKKIQKLNKTLKNLCYNMRFDLKFKA
ncbi:hypothetical protein DMC01_04260 [Campylobacter troglodytis]|nr:hypothetical protein DMC01_04260 [Campylobacter troglodytis]